MPTFTLTVTPAEGTRVMNALCQYEGISPATQAGALKVLKDYVTNIVKTVERDNAAAAIVDGVPIVPT